MCHDGARKDPANYGTVTIEAMITERASGRRLKFFGLNDYATFCQVEYAAEVLEVFDPLATAYSVSDIIELHHAQLFAEHDLFPQSYNDRQRVACRAVVPQIKAAVGKFFNSLVDANFADLVRDVDRQYHSVLLQLLARFNVYDRCAASTVLPALNRMHIGLGQLLACKCLVRRYDSEVRALLLSDPTNAEHVIRRDLENSVQQDVHLPPSLDLKDQRTLVNEYVNTDNANPNFIQLISIAPVGRGGVVDAKMKLRARRKYQRWTEEFFKENSGMTTGCEVVIADEQTEPVEVSMDRMVVKFSYSRHWLEHTLDYPSILNNFLHVFAFADRGALLTFPSYSAQLGVFERYIWVTGKGSYPAGAAFRTKEASSFLQTAFYRQFLSSKGIEVESVIAWFFSDYLKNEFGALNFRYTPSTAASTYLEKCRNIFAEMDSILRQFSLYVEDGELDIDLLAITSEQIRYRDLPSFMVGKYIYPTNDQDIHYILYLLFSDQSGLGYINEELKGDCAARLLIHHQVSYSEFANHQRSQVDYLIQQGVLTDTGEKIGFASVSQFVVLRDIFEGEVANYYHYPVGTRLIIDEMVTRGWVERRKSLLSEAEARYFNYCLNQVDFSSGPDLRNKYVHGSNADPADEHEHFRTYVTALKLLIAFVIKINDEFCLRGNEVAGIEASDAA